MRTLIFLCLLIAAPAMAQTPSAENVYRVPFANGTEVRVGNDHATHSPTRNRLDISSINGGADVVAAAAGRVMWVEDDNNTICLAPPSSLEAAYDTNNDGTLSSGEINAGIALSALDSATIQSAFQNLCGSYNGPSANCCINGLETAGQTCAWGGGSGTCLGGADGEGPNNYVWIRHENGEWTKYTHFRTNSVVVNVNDDVVAGQKLGVEGDVGVASGQHVHFEVAEIDDISAIGAQGWLNDNDGVAGVNIVNRVPTFCEHGLLKQGDRFNVVKCSDTCGLAAESLSGVITASNSPRLVQATDEVTSDATIQAGGGVTLRSEGRVTLTPGFRAAGGSDFAAMIRNCDSPGGTGD